MISPSNEDLLFGLLVKLARGEKAVELQRIALCHDYSFNPVFTFDCLDSQQINSLTPLSFKDLLQKTRSDISEEDIRLLIWQYSSYNDGRLQSSDFMNLVLPSTQPYKHHLIVSRRIVSRSINFEFGLIRLIEKEIELQIELEDLKQELAQEDEFSAMSVFKLISEDDQFIYPNSLYRFGRKHDYIFLNDEISAILRRIQTKDMNRIDYNDFAEFLLPRTIISKKTEEGEEDNEEVIESEEEDNEEVIESGEEEEIQSEKDMSNEESEELDTPEKTAQDEVKPKKSIAKLHVEDEFQKLLISQVETERSIEHLRERLSIEKSFTVDAVFKMELAEDNNCLYIADFENLLDQLEVPYKRDFIYPLFKRYGGMESASPAMELDHFKKLLLPLDSNYSNKVLARQEQELSHSAKTHLKKLLCAILETEEEMEEIRKSISSHCDVAEIFKQIDLDNDQFLSSQELLDAINKAELDVTQNELGLIMDRYLHGRLENIDFKLFAEELEPRDLDF